MLFHPPRINITTHNIRGIGFALCSRDSWDVPELGVVGRSTVRPNHDKVHH